MPPISRTEVPAHPSRAWPEALKPGDPYVFFFVGFLLAVAGVLFLGSGWARVSDEGVPALLSERRGLAGLGLLAAGAACWLPLGRRFRRTRAKAGSPSALPAWRTDHDWDPTGAGSELDGVSGFRAAWLLAGTLALVPLLQRQELGFRIAGVAGAFLFTSLWVQTVYRFARRTKFGRSRLRFVRCPYPPGGELVVYLQDLDRLKGARSLTATLRFVAEEREERLSWRRKGRKWTRYAHFEEVRRLGARDLPFGSGAPARALRFFRPADPEAELPLRFDLPRDGSSPRTEDSRRDRYETRLGANPPRYWELEVKADLPGIDYAALFVLPVYPAR